MKEMLQNKYVRYKQERMLQNKIDNLPPKQKSTKHAFSILHTPLLQATNIIEILG